MNTIERKELRHKCAVLFGRYACDEISLNDVSFLMAELVEEYVSRSKNKERSKVNV